MSLATGVAALALSTLAACGSDDGPGTPEGSSPSSSASASASPTSAAPTEDPADAADLAGTWRDDEVDWTVTFKADGTFSEDFQGVPEFRTGDYEVTDGVVTLMGGDGNDDEGTIKDGTLVFKLGTLVRQ
ncbi:lipocalin family protein [Aeromicrobium sp. 50.2.37]|uniref:lipocalin family protein n=1 Tax=Aeromicrobium sp. 50.2.37 TaxID=2969305 RepID=UPI00214F9CF8|nr:lipocalin family protein [Aeromicrobium sp. 50.2.37]MCR4514836.1 lipocalin family protein [Aeromicrobium sp. 50.2.37]